MFKSFISAMRTLTAIPVPGEDCEPFENSLYAFPVVGAVLGALLCAAAFLLHGPLPASVAAAMLLTAQTLLTRGFHLDGIADAADGFGGGYTRERALAIMKDSQIGAFGALALILTLLLKFTLFTALLNEKAMGGIFAAMVISRTAQVFQCVAWPYARPNGTAAATVQNATQHHLMVTLLICAGLLFLTGLKFLLLLPFGLVAAWLWGLYCRKRVGGITGDLLGATSELVEITILIGSLLIR
ncbi:adenosylcobinamide-GDP ribazoletransferase [Verrucomicrobiota bacterium]